MAHMGWCVWEHLLLLGMMIQGSPEYVSGGETKHAWCWYIVINNGREVALFV